MSTSDARREIALLVNSHYPIICLETWEETRATEILTQVAEDLVLPLYDWTLSQGMARLGGAPIYNTQEPLQVLTQISALDSDGLYLLKDFHKDLSQDIIVRKLRDISEKFRRARRAIFILAPSVVIPVELEKDVARFTLSLPDEQELGEVAAATLRDLQRQYKIQVNLPPGQGPLVARALGGLTGQEARRVLNQAVLEKMKLDLGAISLIRSVKGSLVRDQGVLEFLEPSEDLKSVGGLGRLKSWLDKRRGALTPEGERFGLEPPRGVLILGTQGCGKSLCAKAVAREWNMQLLKFDSSSLFDKYIGESEKNLRKSLQVAEAVAPAVLWIDEIEKMFPNAALHSESDGGLSMRIFGTFLTWMQEKKAAVFVVATSNDISALPPELLRKGRFDEIFFVDLPTPEERKIIFTIHLSRRKQEPSKFDLTRLAAASEGFSGAEIEQAISSALYTAFSLKSPLSTEMILKELQSTYPLSTTMREKVEALREWARERAVPAS
jgi:ATPase family associated with various cellular activities (AAA)